MDRKKQTLTIYGIQDRENYKYPFYVHDHKFCHYGKWKGRSLSSART